MILEGLQGRVEYHYPLKRLNTWKIGGAAEIVFWPENESELQRVWLQALRKEVPIRILGRGSNVLFPDEGLSGITVVSTKLQQIHWGAKGVKAEAGYSLIRLALEAGQHGLSGLEFACGIPGTIGGAIVMNAGAHGGEIRDILAGVKILTLQGEILYLSKDRIEFAYRECSLRDQAVILEADFCLRPGDRDAIQTLMAEKLNRRKDTQPLDYPNAGSVFRNPPGESAGRLIEQAGWKGKKRGGAAVSAKHANFIINTGEATAQDVLTLIHDIQEDVFKRFGVELKTEIEYISPV